MVRFKLIQGLTDPEIKEHILSEEDKSLDETVKAIEAKESGKIARKTIGVPTSPAKVNLMVLRDGSANRRCNCCGRQGHSSDRTSREKDCPAFGKKCLKCGKQDHFRSVCKSGTQPKKTDVAEVTKDEAVDIGTIGQETAGISP